MVLGQAWTDAMERAVVDPAKNATLGHVQVYRADAAADETGEISFIMPQNNYRLIQNPVAFIKEARGIDPRIESGLSRLMVGALLSFKETTMDVRKRQLLRVAIGEGERSGLGEVVNALMGSKPEARFRFIQERAAFAKDLDI